MADDMNLVKPSSGFRNSVLKIWHSFLSMLGADWIYEKSFFYLIVGGILFSMLLKGITLIDEINLGQDLIWTTVILCMGVLAVAFFFAFGTRLLVKAIKKEFQ